MHSVVTAGVLTGSYIPWHLRCDLGDEARQRCGMIRWLVVETLAAIGRTECSLADVGCAQQQWSTAAMQVKGLITGMDDDGALHSDRTGLSANKGAWTSYALWYRPLTLALRGLFHCRESHHLLGVDV